MARKARWKIVLGIVGVVVLVCGAVVLWVWSVAARRWEGMRAEALRILREDQAKPAERPVLRGTAVPGNAWEDYAAAMAASDALSADDRTVIFEYQMANWAGSNSTYPRKRPGRRRMDGLLSRGSAALTLLQRGAGRSESRHVARGSDGALLNKVEYLSVTNLVVLAVAKARHLADDGRAREAADLLLDLAQFGRDVCAGTRLSGGTAWWMACDLALRELRPLVLSGWLPSDDLLRIEKGLETLDGSFPRRLLVAPTDMMEYAFEFLEAENLFAAIRDPWPTGDQPPAWSAWRHLFCDRLMVVDAFDEGMNYVRQCESLKGASWAESRRVDELVDQKIEETRNPMVKLQVWQLMHWGGSTQVPLTHIRLLRIAAHYRATGEFLEIDDPFGGTLRHAENGCRWKLWSVDQDGVDNGGDDRANSLGSSPDIVLEIDR